MDITKLQKDLFSGAGVTTHDRYAVSGAAHGGLMIVEWEHRFFWKWLLNIVSKFDQ